MSIDEKGTVVQDVAVRTAVHDDGPALARIDHETWSWQVAPVPRWPADKPFFENGRVPDDVLVAVVDGRPAGYLALQRPALASAGHVRNINGIAVDPAHQGRGIGGRLLSAARETAAADGARRITLRVLGGNTRARALYESCGYRIEGVLSGEFLLDGRYVDDIFMALDLVPDGC